MLNLKWFAILLGVGFLLSGLLGPNQNLMAAEGPALPSSSTQHLIYFLIGIIFLAGSSYGYGRQTVIAIGLTLLIFSALDYANFSRINNAEPDFANITERLFKTAMAAIILMIGLLSSSSDDRISKTSDQT